MLQTSRVTAFTVSELLRENQPGGGKITPHPPRLRLNLINDGSEICQRSLILSHFVGFQKYYKDLLRPLSYFLNIWSTKDRLTVGLLDLLRFQLSGYNVFLKLFVTFKVTCF